MSHPSRPSRFLDELRRQSDAVRRTESAQRPVEDVLRELDRALWSGFRWLEEALRHLEVIRPAVQHAFGLPGILTIDHPRFERGFITSRRRALAGMDLLDYVELFYRLAGDDPILVKVQPGAAASVEARLRAAHLRFRYDTDMDEHRVVRNGVFAVAPEINACVRLAPDYHRQRVEVTLHNVDRFESVILDFPGMALDEAALEDLVHLVLGEGNQFLRRAPLAGMGARRHDAPITEAAAEPGNALA
jgi:hypothetical protein